MKTSTLNKISAVFFLMITSFFTFSQNVNGKIWVTIEDQNVLPTSQADILVSNDAEFNNLIQTLNVTDVKRAFPSSRKASLLKVYEITSTSSSSQLYMEAVNNVKALTGVEYAPEYTTLYTPNDYSHSVANDYALDLINAKDAWGITHGSSSFIIGVSDENFDVNHEELAGKVSHYNNNGGSTSHGNMVAITAAGNTNNGTGKSSIGFDSKLALYNMDYNEILVATYSGIKVINLSWSAGCTYSQYAQDVVNEAYNNGTFIVASAGNGILTCGGSSEEYVYPSSYNNVFSVTSVGANDNHLPISGTVHTHNDKVDLCAPGYQVAVSPLNGFYMNLDGSSFAAPFVTGTVALMLAVNPCMENNEIDSILRATAVNINANNAAYIGKLGSGRLDAYEAVLAASQLQKLIINGTTFAACDNASNGSITIVGDSGVAPYTAAWNNGLSGLNISGLAAGSYSVVLTDSQGCFANSTFVVDAATPIEITGSANVACASTSGSITVNASMGTAPYTATWSNGATGMSVNNLSAGSYTVVVTDNEGCSSDSTFVVNGATPLTTTSTVTDVTCNGLNDGAVDVTITTGTPTYTYQWDNGATTEDIMDLTAGTYRLTVIDGDGCKTYASYTVIEPEVLDATLITVDPNSSALGSIDLNVNGGTPSYTYAWNTGETTEDISGLTAGYYEVTVTDANGCYVVIDTDLENTSLSSVGELTDGEVSVYPNPVKDNATINWAGSDVDYLTITNMSGQVVTNENVSMTNTFAVSNLNAGVYMINLITSNNQKLTKKFIVL